MFQEEHLVGSSMKKCTRCNGNKNIVGMGGMKMKCNECSGVGFMIEPKATPKEVVVPMVKATRKRANLTEVKTT